MSLYDDYRAALDAELDAIAAAGTHTGGRGAFAADLGALAAETQRRFDLWFDSREPVVFASRKAVDQSVDTDCFDYTERRESIRDEQERREIDMDNARHYYGWQGL